eukprot:7375920-Pyramimonas_sp.AAC.1
MVNVPKIVFGTVKEWRGAPVTLIRVAEIPRTACWHDSGSSRNNSGRDSRRWNPKDGVLAQFKISERSPFQWGNSFHENEPL